ncbi:MAG TPA: phosphoribosylanthranilate isomerase [Dehalococcoidia bacterium]|nr:phosphoribosylanthranilate isomerase [Dehalococcoidia bacterium]
MTMPRTRIKLCGLRTGEQAALAAELAVDFVGLIFAEQSRRRVTVEEARRVVAALGPDAGSLRQLQSDELPAGGWFARSAAALELALARRRPLVVGVFGDQPASLINAVAEAVPLDLVQLSGTGPWEQALEIHRPVIKALHVRPALAPDGVFNAAEVGTAALVLLDTAVPGTIGGTGQRFDWSLAARVASRLPFLLAGGLTPENVGAAVGCVRPWGVDVSSGIESDGAKDAEKMRAFVAAVRDVGPPSPSPFSQ